VETVLAAAVARGADACLRKGFAEELNCTVSGRGPMWEAEEANEYVRQAALLRDVVGNPFRIPFIDPAWTKWNDGAVVRLARTIYEERRFEAMPILADALEDAGCCDEVILNHCRAGGEHARGCWVVDALLGKS
jgi:hypothetical protein